jgi:hypothetical protein
VVAQILRRPQRHGHDLVTGVYADAPVERRLNPARETVVVPFVVGMMFAGLAGFARS